VNNASRAFRPDNPQVVSDASVVVFVPLIVSGNAVEDVELLESYRCLR